MDARKIILGLGFIALASGLFEITWAGNQSCEENQHVCWYGPGMYWGIHFTDAPTYFRWRSRHWNGPCYWRYQHKYRNVDNQMTTAL